MHQIDGMYRDLARLQLDINGIGKRAVSIVKHLIECVVGAVISTMPVDFPIAVRSRQHVKTAIFGCRVVYRQPKCHTCQRYDRPVFDILVARCRLN